MILKSHRVFIDLRKVSILRKPGFRHASSKVERRPYYKISVKQSVPFIYQNNEQRFTKNNTISLERAIDELGVDITDLRIVTYLRVTKNMVYVHFCLSLRVEPSPQKYMKP